jgi:hypothetical protein
MTGPGLAAAAFGLMVFAADGPWILVFAPGLIGLALLAYDVVRTPPSAMRSPRFVLRMAALTAVDLLLGYFVGHTALPPL